METRALIVALAAWSAILVAAPAAAQVYKWVDERGVTNYSSQPPVGPEAANKVDIVEDKVSVYTPDPALVQAIEALRRDGGASARIAELERQLDAERRARQRAAASPPRPSDPCASGAIDCSTVSGPYYVTRPVVAVPPRLRPRPRPHLRPAPAMIANFPTQSASRPLLAAASEHRSRPPRPGPWDLPR